MTREPVESIAAAIARGASYLERRGVANPERNARFLLAHALATDLSGLVARLGATLSPDAARAYGRLLCERGGRRPLQHILGSWEFWGLELEVGPAALIPRPETETLVEVVLGLLPRGPCTLADVGTGTGALACALASERTDATVIAIDREPAALALARRNIARHDLADRVHLVEGDLLAPLAGRVAPASLAAVVSNPPYVAEADLAALEPEVREHEPRSALVSGPTGLELIERLLATAPPWLEPGGLVAIEIGAGQAEAALAATRAVGVWEGERTWPDLSGVERVLGARRRAAPAVA